jgi:hypothetical protein
MTTPESLERARDALTLPFMACGLLFEQREKRGSPSIATVPS